MTCRNDPSSPRTAPARRTSSPSFAHSRAVSCIPPGRFTCPRLSRPQRPTFRPIGSAMRAVKYASTSSGESRQRAGLRGRRRRRRSGRRRTRTAGPAGRSTWPPARPRAYRRPGLPRISRCVHSGGRRPHPVPPHRPVLQRRVGPSSRRTARDKRCRTVMSRLSGSSCHGRIVSLTRASLVSR